MASEFVGLDLLVSKAGVEHFGALQTITQADFDRLSQTNVAGQLFVTQRAVAAMTTAAGSCPGPRSVCAWRSGRANHRHQRDRQVRLDGTDALCTGLGCLPLAIEQADAYIAEVGITAQEYLRLLGEYPADIYSQAAEGGDAQRTRGVCTGHAPLGRPLAGHYPRCLWVFPGRSRTRQAPGQAASEGRSHRFPS